jgi:hypothetical protein
MARRVAVLFALLLTLVAPMAFPLGNGCSSFECMTNDDVNEYCTGSFNGRFSGCTTIRQCSGGGGGCITYCQYTSCYWV